METNFRLDGKFCVSLNKITFINQFQTFKNSFNLFLNIDLKLQYAIMKADMLNL